MTKSEKLRKRTWNIWKQENRKKIAERELSEADSKKVSESFK